MMLLHLSDLHFGNKNRFADDAATELANAFHRALRIAIEDIKADSEISLVLITGDLVESGLPSEFRYAHEFLISLADQLSLRPERFVIIPGNHDISWDDCQIVRAGLKGEKFAADEFDARLNAEKLSNYRTFLANFYGAPVTGDSLAGLPDSRPLDGGGWLRDFPELELSVAGLNTSERENDKLKGGFLSVQQAQSLMTLWREGESVNRLKIIALHHNPVSTTSENMKWSLDWLRAQERKAGVPAAMPANVFEQYVADLAGFEGKEHLSRIVKDTAAHLVLHGHHHDQGDPILWPWAKNGSAPVLSVGSFGLNEEQLPGRAPLSCQIIRFLTPTDRDASRLIAIPLVYDGRFRLEGQVLAGSFRIEAHSRGAYDQPLPLSQDWKKPDPSKTLVSEEPRQRRASSTPRPPILYAQPAYIGSHQFVGRQAQLETLSDWASASDSHSVLLFEAIGGTGKSILTWEWTTKQATSVRQDWAGRVWYSFYEKGATMADCCRRTLSYMTGRSLERFREKNTAELTELLMDQLRERPWLVVLDGVERVLVAYHRFDAAQIPDDEAGTADKIAHRDPCGAINPEDDDLLHALAGAQPSKILLTSRLIPRTLLNRSSQPIPGVLHERLPGLRPADAESLIRACGVVGTSTEIQKYLKINCDCHPLVIGVLAGLISDYLQDRGNFDAWVIDPRGGGQLSLADLDLVQKRNHILGTALAALSKKSRELLSTLALLSEPVDYPTLCALNPYLPPLPEEIGIPIDPKSESTWKWKSTDQMAKALKKYEDALQRRRIYDDVLAERKAVSVTALQQLEDTVRDLERRGLLQYDRATRRHDLHPVVRGISAGGLKQEERNQLGQRVFDHFSQQAESPYEKAETLEDFGNARRIVNALFHMGELKRARAFLLKSDFLRVMTFRFEAHNEILAIIRPFFTAGWSEMPPSLQTKGRALINRAAVALRRLGQLDDAFAISEMLLRWTLNNRPNGISCRQFLDFAGTVGDQHRFALEERLLRFAGDCAPMAQDPDVEFAVRLARFRQLSRLGRWTEADALLPLLMETYGDEKRAILAHHRAVSLHFRGELTEIELQKAEELAQAVGSALGRRNLAALRGWWSSDQLQWQKAKESLTEAVALAHKAGKIDRRSEVRLALARFHLNDLDQVEQIADQLSTGTDSSLHLPLSLLWLAAGNKNQAEVHAAAAYEWASGDGEPYCHWYECKHACAVLTQLGARVPTISPFDHARSEVLPWEAEVISAIEALKMLPQMWRRENHVA
jgi:tetratricopeptide (TPR) repeat protein